MQTFTEAIQFYTAFYTAVTFFARHFQIIIIKFPMTDVKTSSYFSVFFFSLLLAVIFPTRQWTSYCTQTDIQTDTNIQSRYKEIDGKEEKEQGRGPEAGFEHHACRQVVTVTGRWQQKYKKSDSTANQQVNKDVISKP